MMNPIEILKNFKGRSPQDIILNQMMGDINNPMLKNLINMAKNGQNQNIETFARNLMKEQGKDFDSEFANFMKQLR